jgi:hypothetical protein
MATYANGSVVLDGPVDWPNGARLELVHVSAGQSNGTSSPSGIRRELLEALNDPKRYGLDESLWPQTPQEIALLLRHMDAAESLQMTDDELATMEADRHAEKERQKELTRESWRGAEQLFP